MNTDIRLTVDCPDHPKIEKLCRRLGEGAFRCWIRLLGFTAQNHPDGNLNGMDGEDVEIAAGWKGEPGRFTTELQSLGLLDRPDGYQLHDWLIHQPYATDAPNRKIRGIKGNLASQVSKGILTEAEAAEKLNQRVALLKPATSTATSRGLFATSRQNLACSTAPLPSPPAPAPAPKARVLRTPALSEFPEHYLAFVKELFPEDSHIGWSDTEWAKQVDSLDKLIRLDGFVEEEVFAVLRFGRADDFWDGVFNSIPRLRESGQKKYRNMRGQWEKKRNGQAKSENLNKRMSDDSRFINPGVRKLK